MTPPPPDPRAVRRALLAWYDRHRRDIPWRVPPGAVADPYRVWLSEVLCQQTTVAAAIPYYHAFLERWPTVAALAAADTDAVLRAWQGLGYYARARNLLACARRVAGALDGRFPDTEDELRALPGIGPYTAAAVAAIAFGRAASPVDGNVARVAARLFAITDPPPAGRPRIAAAAATLTPAKRAGDFAQALMDLGAMVCVPRRPRCGDCPLEGSCAARALGIAATLPARAAKAERPSRRGIAFWTVRADGAVLLRRRPETGLLAGLMEIPSTPWRADAWTAAEATAFAPVAGPWTASPGRVVHVFSHFRLELEVWTGHAPRGANVEGTWARPADFVHHALPTLTRKVARLAMGE